MNMQDLQHNSPTFLKGILTGLLMTTTYFVSSAQLPADQIKAIIEKEVYQKRSPSIIVGTIDATGKRQIVAAGSYKDKDQVLPDEKTMYEIGSITKVFTTLLLADMVLKKQVNLEDPISKYLPASVKLPIVKGKEITLLNLATNVGCAIADAVKSTDKTDKLNFIYFFVFFYVKAWSTVGPGVWKLLFFT